jgi:plasmid stabilization system protein ParE
LALKLFTSAEADKDFIRIYEHYAYDRAIPHIADKIDVSLRHAIEHILPVSPGIGKILKSPNVRAFLVNRSHWIIYSYTDTALMIRRIVSAKENTNWENI